MMHQQNSWDKLRKQAAHLEKGKLAYIINGCGYACKSDNFCVMRLIGNVRLM